MDGVSLLPLLKGDQLTARNISYSYKDDRVIRNGRWKLYGTYKTRQDKPGPWRLYDLSTDQSETRDVSKQHPEVVKQLAAEWDKWEQEIRVIKGYQGFWDKKAGKAGKSAEDEKGSTPASKSRGKERGEKEGRKAGKKE